MYAITGMTGQVGGALAGLLLDGGQAVRAVVRDPVRAAPWAARGAELALADLNDAAALRRAFDGVEGVFILLPPVFDPSPDFAETRRTLAALREALLAVRPARVVCLSTIGAQVERPNLLGQLGMMEQVLGTLGLPVTFLRAAWFIENSLWDVAPARSERVFPSYLQPLDRPVPMVACADVAALAARLLQEDWSGRRVVELEGPVRLSPNDIAAGFSRLLGHEVRAQAVPRAEWQARFLAQGMRNPLPRMQMLDGFNEGWIEFEAGRLGSRKGGVALDTALAGLLARA